MSQDSQNLCRLAQPLVVDFKQAYGSPPRYPPNWTSLWAAKVDRIVINAEKPSIATIWFPTRRWEQNYGLLWGDMVRIRTDQPNPANWTVLFIGFVTGYDREFSGGSGEPGTSFERNAIICQDHRWLMATTSAVTGQIGRSPDDFESDGSVKDESCTQFSGRRTIFNLDGKPNKSTLPVKKTVYDDTHVFCEPSMPFAQKWTAAEMLWYILSPIRELSFNYLIIFGLSDLAGITNDDSGDWDIKPNHIVVDCLNSLEAILLICKHIGWSFRLDFWPTQPEVVFSFYKNINSAYSYDRLSNTVVKHLLYAPPAGDNLAAAVSRGEKLLWAASLVQDIAPVINSPIALGAPHRFEFTAQLVPAWKDASLVPDINHLFFTEAEIADLDNPDDYSFFRAYHSRGVQFASDKDLRLVGRRWCLNESGTYSASEPTPAYDRGPVFKWEDYLPAAYVTKQNYGWFRRRLLNCLTARPDDENSIGIIVEFSFDAGVTWQQIPCSIHCLEDECGIYISEPNLSEIKPKVPAEISGGTLDGEDLNYWTRLCDDYLEERSFKNSQWKTRVRVTASVQMDQRVKEGVAKTSYSGSPFDQTQLYDFSEKYGLTKRTASSIFNTGGNPVKESSDEAVCLEHISKIRDSNEDMSISGRYTLERLWLGDGDGWPDFLPGDYIEKITGRNVSLGVSFKGGIVYPQIVQIIYLPEKQKQVLITRDLRFSEPNT